MSQDAMNIEEIRATTQAAARQSLGQLRQQAAAHQVDTLAEWRALVDRAQARIRAASDAGKSYAEVSVKDREEYRNLAGHFEADGFKCNADGDGDRQMVCTIRW